MDSIKLYQKTNYPKIYQRCYWGNAEYKENEHVCNPLIISNRNEFVEKYQPIVKQDMPLAYQLVSLLKNSKYRRIIDHVEVYKISSGYIILNSLYNHYNREKLSYVLSLLGFMEYSQMYSTNAYTFIKFATVQQLRDDIRMIKSIHGNFFIKKY